MAKRFQGNIGHRDSNGNLIYGPITNTILQQQVTVGTSATAIPTTALFERITILITNVGGEPIYLGASTVLVTNGFPLFPRAVLRIDIEPDVTVFGIAANSTNVRIIEGS